MVPDTDFTAALNKPLDVVQQIYSDAQDKSQANITKLVETHFRQLFASPDASAKVPTLSPGSIESLLHASSGHAPNSHRLVRFRAMIQDTGLGTEVFLAKHQHDGRTLTGMFGGEASIPASNELSNDSDHQDFGNQDLAERTVMYAVSVPGQTAWAAQAHRESAAGQNTDSTVEQLATATSAVSLEEPQSPQKVREVRERIRRAAQKGKEIGSTGKEPRLVAISKLHPPSAILAAHKKADQLHFGENYVQEMVDKAKVLPKEIRWHFVGGLQSNKGKLLASIPNLYLLETLDSVKAANVLQKALASPDAAKRDEPLRVYLQVNTSGEDAKSGLPPILSQDAEQAKNSELLNLAVHVITKCPNLRLRGVMTIGAAANSSSASEEAAQPKSIDEIVSANPDFERLIHTRSNLVELLRQNDEVKNSEQSHIKEAYSELLEGKDATGGLELSMGMSADMDVATMAGSDNVRVGTDCFGRRPATREEAMNSMKRELEVGPEAAAAELKGNGSSASPSSSTTAAASSTSSVPRAYLAKAPLPEAPHVGALVKLYDVEAAEKFKTTELIEVVGILDTAGLPQAEWQETGSAAGSSEPAQVPCVHAIYASAVELDSFGPEDASSAAPSSSALSQSSERQALIEYLAGALSGDKLAAELVLLAVIARIHARRANLCLGALTLNISNFAAPSSNSAQTQLSRRLNLLLSAVVDVSMDLASLNDERKPLYPKSAGEGTGLEAGRLQLVNGTTLVVNEGTMGEGQLKESGIRNIRALSSVLEQHKLPYAFPYSEFEFETDLNAVILSHGKSFLPFDIQCPLQATEENADLYSTSVPQVDEGRLRGWRKALLNARSLGSAKAFEIPDAVSEHIQHEFVTERRKEQEEAKDSHGGASNKEGALGQEDLLRRMAIVRLLALSHGEKSLTTEMWSKAVELDKEVSQRLKPSQPQQQYHHQPGSAAGVSR